MAINNRTLVHSVCYVSEVASSSDGDVDRYVIIRKLVDAVFNMLPVFIRQWEVQIYRMILNWIII
jgi:hypothetical protein